MLQFARVVNLIELLEYLSCFTSDIIESVIVESQFVD